MVCFFFETAVKVLGLKCAAHIVDVPPVPKSSVSLVKQTPPQRCVFSAEQTPAATAHRLACTDFAELVVPHLPRRVQLQFVSQEGGPLRYGQPGGVGALQRSQQRPHLPGEVRKQAPPWFVLFDSLTFWTVSTQKLNVFCLSYSIQKELQ